MEQHRGGAGAAVAGAPVPPARSGGGRWLQSRLGRAMIGKPRCLRMAATVELSTPPDMAMAMGAMAVMGLAAVASAGAIPGAIVLAALMRFWTRRVRARSSWEIGRGGGGGRRRERRWRSRFRRRWWRGRG